MLQEGSVELRHPKSEKSQKASEGKNSKENDINKIEVRTEILSQKVRELKTISEKAKNVTGSSLSDVNRFIKNIQKKSANGEIIKKNNK